jgi:hypothetical protein
VCKNCIHASDSTEELFVEREESGLGQRHRYRDGYQLRQRLPGKLQERQCYRAYCERSNRLDIRRLDRQGLQQRDDYYHEQHELHGCVRS